MSDPSPSGSPDSSGQRNAKRSLFRNRPAWAKVDRESSHKDSTDDLFSSRSRHSLEQLEADRKEKKQRDREEAEREAAKEAEKAERRAKRQKLAQEQQKAQANGDDDHESPIALGENPHNATNSSPSTPKRPKDSNKISSPSGHASPKKASEKKRRSTSNAVSPTSKSPIHTSLLDANSKSPGKAHKPDTRNEPSNLPRDADDDDVDDDVVIDEDPLIKESRERLRRAKEKQAQQASFSSTSTSNLASQGAVAATPPPPAPDAKLRILVWSKLENTVPLIVTRLHSQRLREVRQAWCQRQTSLPVPAADVFLTWRGMRLYDTTTCRSLGVSVDADGEVYIKGQMQPPGEESAQLAMEATTQAAFEREREARDAGVAPSEARRPNRTPTPPSPPPASQRPAPARTKIILRAKGYQEYKLIVNATTTFGQILRVFRKERRIPEEREAFLVFDGERLDERVAMGESEISDMDNVEVHVRD